MQIEAKLQSIQSTYPFRDVQTRQLFHYLNLAETSNIVVHGPRATCKTSIVRAIVEHFELFHAWINLLHHVNTRNICASILKQVQSQLMNRAAEHGEEIKQVEIASPNSIAFIEKLERLLNILAKSNKENDKDLDNYTQKLVIILDNADSLFKNENDEFIYLMNYLEGLTNNHHRYPISVIYISTHSVDWLMRQSEFKIASLQVVFNNYSTDELLRLLSSRIMSDFNCPPEFYSKYGSLMF